MWFRFSQEESPRDTDVGPSQTPGQHLFRPAAVFLLEAEYRDLVNCFATWCGINHLLMNVAKTKEMVADFHCKEPSERSKVVRRLTRMPPGILDAEVFLCMSNQDETLGGLFLLCVLRGL